MKGYMDYMMVLSPPDLINEAIKKYKQESAQLVGDYGCMDSLTYISITNLIRQKDYLTEPRISLAERKLKALPPISLSIDGFDHFSHGEDFKTIYAKIRATPATTRWFKELKKPLNMKQYLVPHITIARNVRVDQFNQLWPQFKEAKWSTTFNIDRLTVLQRETFASFAPWELHKELPFEGQIPLAESKPKRDMVNLRKGNYAASQQISLF